MDTDTLLVVKRLEAHHNYLISRIHDKKKKAQFNEAMIALGSFNLDYFNDPNNQNEGSRLALDIWKEIMQIHGERFLDGRTGDAYLEKL
jgi:hypothetical protein